MRSTTRELYAVDGGPLALGSVVEVLSAEFTVETGTQQLVHRLRVDTSDRRLQAAGLSLEHQIVASGERLVLDRLDGSSTMKVSVTGLRWPAPAGSLPEGAVRDLVAPATGIRALTVVADQTRRRHRLSLHDAQGKTVARVELDEPVSQNDVVPAEVWLLTRRGHEKQARQAARLLSGAGLRGVTRAQDPPGDSVTPELNAVRTGLTADSRATALLSTVLHDFLMTMTENLPGLLDDVDSELLHDFRVAVRRTRSTLKLARPALPEVMRTRWEPAFKWLGDLTTPVRDLDVYELDLATMAGRLVATDPSDLEPFAARLRSRRSAEREVLVRGLRSVRFRRLAAGWAEELARLDATPNVDLSCVVHQSDDVDQLDEVDQPAGAAGVPRSAGWLADRSISKAHRRVLRGGAAISGDSPPADLHWLRKRCKELRYALEVFAPVVDRAAGKRVVNDLRGLQDVLGRFQDAEVQRRALRGFAEEMMADATPAATVLAMGELIGYLDAEQDRARSEFDVAFSRFTRRSSRRLMHRLVVGR